MAVKLLGSITLNTVMHKLPMVVPGPPEYFSTQYFSSHYYTTSAVGNGVYCTHYIAPLALKKDGNDVPLNSFFKGRSDKPLYNLLRPWKDDLEKLNYTKVVFSTYVSGNTTIQRAQVFYPGGNTTIDSSLRSDYFQVKYKSYQVRATLYPVYGGTWPNTYYSDATFYLNGSIQDIVSNVSIGLPVLYATITRAEGDAILASPPSISVDPDYAGPGDIVGVDGDVSNSILFDKVLSQQEYEYLDSILKSLQDWDTSLKKFPPTVSQIQELVDYYNSIGKTEEADFLLNIKGIVDLVDITGCFIDKNAKEDFLYKIKNGLEEIYFPEKYLVDSGMSLTGLEKFKPTFFGQFMDTVYEGGIVNPDNKTILPILGAVIGAGVGVVTAPYVSASALVSVSLHAVALGLTLLLKDSSGKLTAYDSNKNYDGKFQVSLVSSSAPVVPSGLVDNKNIYSPPLAGFGNYVPPSGSILETLQQQGYFDKGFVVPPQINLESNSSSSNVFVQDYVDKMQQNLQNNINKPVLPGQTVVFPSEKPSNLPTVKPPGQLVIPVPDPSVTLPNGGNTVTNNTSKPLLPDGSGEGFDNALLDEILEKVNEIGGDMGLIAGAIDRQTAEQTSWKIKELNEYLLSDARKTADIVSATINELKKASMEKTSIDGLDYSDRIIHEHNSRFGVTSRGVYTDSMGESFDIPSGYYERDIQSGKFQLNRESQIEKSTYNVAMADKGEEILLEHEENKTLLDKTDLDPKNFGFEFDDSEIPEDLKTKVHEFVNNLTKKFSFKLGSGGGN